MIEEFHFLRPLWLLALPVILVLVFYLHRVQGRGSDWSQVIEPELLEALTYTNSSSRRWWIDLLIAAMVFAVIALAGPSLKKDTRPVFRKADARIILFDISRSMNAADIAPTRLVRARSAVARILEESQGHRTGLIAYAGDAWLMAPLTRDGRTLKTMLNVLETNVAPVQGSRPDRALLLAEKIITRSSAKNVEIIVLTDGFKGSRPAELATSLRARGHRISVLAAGTTQGATIPASGGKVVRDFNKEVVVARTDMTLLGELAAAGGGTLRSLEEPIDSLTSWLESMKLAVQADDDINAAERDEVITWRDDGPWLILPLLLLASLAFRRGWLMLLPLVMVCNFLLPAPVAYAGFLDLFIRKDQRTAAAIERGDFESALESAPDSAWSGTVSYRRGDFASAALFYSDDNSADGHYNRGNALAMLGKYEEALDAYKAALDRYPDHEDATFNFGIVRKLLEEQEQERNKNNAEVMFDDADGSGSEAEGVSPGATVENESEPDESESDVLPGDARVEALGDNEISEEGTPVAPQYTEEELLSPQEVIIWLDRVPDDPSGLIRRKFAIEQSQRRRQTSDRGQSW